MASQTLNIATMPLPFEQLPRESAKAFAAFKTYLDMGPERSLEAVRVKCDKSARLIQRWSSRWHWAERVAAHAAHLAAIERQTIEGLAVEKAVEWHRLHESLKREAWREAEETIAMVRQARQTWLEKGRVPGWEGMARMLELAFKLKQFATGMPSEIKEVTGEVKATLSIEWEDALKKVYGGPKPAGAVVDTEVVSEPAALPAAATEETKL